MKIETINQMAKTPESLISLSDADYRAKIGDVVSHIRETARKRPIILISGPSGSGKTTSARLIEKALDENGMQTHVLSMDNYFHPLTAKEKILFAENKLDLESPLRLDAELLNAHLDALHEGKEVEIPRFNFLTNEREYSGTRLSLHEGEMIILEGIHALNPTVIAAEDYTTRVYVSVRTRLEFPDGRLLHSSKLRLARRMIRDCRTRGRSYEGTVDLYESVERGENLYIMPYKHRAHFDIDTFHPCEPCFYKNLLPASLSDAEAKYDWLSELFEALALVEPLAPSLLPENSLIREFVGGGLFED